jgi:hypothetical protein
MRQRDSPFVSFLGGRVLEMLAVELEDGRTLVYRAFTPPTRKFLNAS